jgi:hypothetical protein
MVALDPSRRITAEDALSHQYFRNAPQPTPPAQLPKPPVRAHNPLKLGPRVRAQFVISLMHAFPAKRQVQGLLQTSCMQKLPKSYPLLDSPDPRSTQSTVGTVLNICTAPLGLCWRVHAHAAPICPAVQTMMRITYCS